MPRLWARLRNSARRGRRLQGPLQRGRRAARAVGIRRRHAVRSDREEAVLPRLAGRAGLQLRHARLRPALRLLSELGDVAGAARSRGASRRRATSIPRTWPRDAVRQGARVVVSTYNEPLITVEWAVAVFQGGARSRAGDRVCLERQRDAAGARLPDAVDRSLQGRSQELRRPAVSQAGRPSRSRFSTPFARCTRAGCGSRSSRC